MQTDGIHLYYRAFLKNGRAVSIETVINHCSVRLFAGRRGSSQRLDLGGIETCYTCGAVVPIAAGLLQ